MPNFSGIWTVTQQMQAKGASTWPATPGAPTIGTATAGTSNCASVAFTAPGCTGYPATITGYRVVSTPGCFTQTGASSPLVVSGLTTGTSYTFKAQATNATGYGALSAASNSITATVQTCASYTTAGTYSWVAPTGVTSVAAVAVGAGGGRVAWCCEGIAGGGGGALAYANGISVTPGNSYSVTVGAFSVGSSGGASTFINTSTVSAGGGRKSCVAPYQGGRGGLVVAGTGGNGGNGADVGGAAPIRSGAGGAGGYAGAGGNGAGFGSNGANGSGGGGGGGAVWYCGTFIGTTGGGVGIFGQGANGAGGTGSGTACTARGKPGSCGSTVLYGGGGCSSGNTGGRGAVRIVWCSGGVRGTPSFPSTNVGA
jgi:hypothetical protein